jgi:hypothetical protein
MLATDDDQFCTVVSGAREAERAEQWRSHGPAKPLKSVLSVFKRSRLRIHGFT